MPVELNHMLNHERIEAMRTAGLWPDRLLIDYLDDVVGDHPDHVAVTDLNSMTGVSTTLSYRQLDRLSRRIGLGLTALGIEKGDVVACQLPNWWQFMALHLACLRIGAILNPLMPIFRERELSYMLGFAESKAIVVPRRFRDFDYPPRATSTVIVKLTPWTSNRSWSPWSIPACTRSNTPTATLIWPT